MAASPLTPKLAKPDSAPKKRLSAARKSLELSQPEVPLQPMSVHTVDMPSPPPSCEHNYSFMSIPPTPKMTEKTEKSGFKLLKKHLLEQDDVCDENVITAILDTITSNSVLRKAVQVRLLKEINMECTTLSARNVAFTSVLSRYRSVANLYHYGDTLLDEIMREMSERSS
ncbi:uncharacterized protein LOC132735397 [Ruditapes philippinarum]|uniref:uncharacterized protein LOC132735397 n=1 Tax=Ruditapes philippinarum TaxID=129788 RepID=UPI00295A9618|nr:uncharacterized protein LOC132735397 [Ruditapes philippinarum]